MKSATIVSILAFAASVYAGACPPVDANAAGSQNVGKAGAQFVTGQCTSDSNCASGCCVLQAGGPVCRNAPALSGGLVCGFTCDGAGGAAAPAETPAAAPAAPAAATGGGACPAVNTNAAGSQNVGKPGAQFVTGQCTSDANCASGCCVLQAGGPVCRNAPALSGGLVCGFSCTSDGSAAPANNAAAAPAAPAPAAPAAATGGGACPAVNANAAGSQNVGVAGAQFVTGQCTSDANCASGCCVLQSGGPVCRNAPALSGGLVCGFSCTSGAAAPETPAPAPAPAAPAPATGGASSTPANGGPPFDPAGAHNVGNGKAAQFIGGQCLSAADCASGCCAGPSGICSGVGAQTQAGKTGCGFVSKRFVARSARARRTL